MSSLTRWGILLLRRSLTRTNLHSRETLSHENIHSDGSRIWRPLPALPSRKSGRDLRITFVGAVLPEEYQQELPASSTAGNRFQLGLVLGARELGASLSVISFEPHAMWKNVGGRFLIRGKSLALARDLECKTVAFVNLPGIKQMCIAANTLYLLFRTCKTDEASGEDHLILVYNSVSFQLIPCLVARAILKLPIGIIVADVPLEANRGGFSGLLQRVERRFELWGLGLADVLVPLSRHTLADFGPNIPALIVEGGQEAEGRTVRGSPRTPRSPRKLLYTGSLNQVSGIDLAIEAVSSIPPGEVVLHIYGSGTPEQVAIVRGAESENVVYHGWARNADVRDAQVEADIVLSPRRPDSFVTRYTFPSKLLEYMASGAPVIGNRLDGIPEEYFEHINVPEAPTSQSWAELIRTMCADESGVYERKAQKARQFVADRKTWTAQAGRMLDFFRAELFHVAD